METITPTSSILKSFMKQLYDNKGTPINLLQDTDIAYGSNANGNYVKFPKVNGKGLLIQWGDITKENTDNITVTLPTPFANKNYSVNVMQEWFDVSNEAVTNSLTTTTFKVIFFKIVGSGLGVHTGSHGIKWTAIGLY